MKSVKGWDKSIHKLNLAVRWADYAAAFECFERINLHIARSEPVPHELLQRFFSFLIDSNGLDNLKDEEIRIEAEQYIQLIKNHLLSQKGYSFSGKAKFIRPGFSIGGIEPKPTTEIIPYGADQMIERAVVAFLRLEEKLTKEDAIRFFYNNLTDYYNTFLNARQKQQVTFYRRSVLAAYLSHIMGYKLSEDEGIKAMNLYQYSRHALAEFSPKKKKKSRR